jgi:hypothetical protein
MMETMGPSPASDQHSAMGTTESYRARDHWDRGGGVRARLIVTVRRANLVWRFRSPHHSSREFATRSSEPKPHEINKLLFFDSEVRK